MHPHQANDHDENGNRQNDPPVPVGPDSRHSLRPPRPAMIDLRRLPRLPVNTRFPGALNYELARLVERPLFSGMFLPWGAASIQVITAPSASHAAKTSSSPQPVTGPGLP